MAIPSCSSSYNPLDNDAPESRKSSEGDKFEGKEETYIDPKHHRTHADETSDVEDKFADEISTREPSESRDAQCVSPLNSPNSDLLLISRCYSRFVEHQKNSDDCVPMNNGAPTMQKFFDEVLKTEKDLNKARREIQEGLEAGITNLQTQFDKLKVGNKIQDEATLRLEAKFETLKMLATKATHQQSPETTVSVADPSKKITVCDVSEFSEGSHEEWIEWKIKLQNKFEVEKWRFTTEEDRVQYLISRLTGKAFQSVYHLTGTNKIEVSVTSVLQHLEDEFGDPQYKMTCRRKLKTLVQGKSSVITFLSDFRYLATATGLEEQQQIEQIRTKINLRLAMKIIACEFSSFRDLRRKLIRVEHSQRPRQKPTSY